MMALRGRHGAGETVARFCQYGVTNQGLSGKRMPAQKATRCLSSASEPLKLFGQQCTGELEHQPLMGGRAAAAAIYPPTLCRAMLRGIEAQRRREGGPMCFSVLRALDEDGDGPCAMPLDEAQSRTSEPTNRVRWADEEPLDMVAAEQVARALAAHCAALEKRIAELAESNPQRVQPEEEHPRVQDEQAYCAECLSQCWDDITCQTLSADLARAARQEELGFMNDWKM